MTPQEILSQIGQHMVEGLMTHSQLADYFYFLGLKGYGRCHNYHFFEENNSYRKIGLYCLDNYNQLLLNLRVNDPEVIPNAWYSHVKTDVAYESRKEHVKTGFEEWVKWEQETKKFYERMYQELMNIGEVAAAAYVAKLVDDVSDELAAARQKHLELSAIDYDMPTIIAEQDYLYKKYKKKLKEIKI